MTETPTPPHDPAPEAEGQAPGKRLLVFQYGDYGDVWRRFRSGGAESYRDQRRSMDHVSELRDRFQVTTVAVCARAHDECLAPGLRSVGIGQATAGAAVGALMDDLAPDLILCRSPNRHVLGWARRRRVPTLPVFADLFQARGLREIAGNLRLRRVLASGVFPCVANHSLNASRSLQRALWLPAARIVPWDWSRLVPDPAAKAGPADPARPAAFYAGMLADAKGLGDCLEAVRILRDSGRPLRFEAAGPGDVEAWRARAGAMGIGDLVTFSGRISHEAVRARMRVCDMVIVPSRHDYAEGLPNTIYEALASRSPLVMSDHPAFAGRLRPGEECVVFRAAQPRDLAARIAGLLDDAGLYARLSEQSGAAHDGLYIGMEWTALVDAFLDDPANRSGWVGRHALHHHLPADTGERP